MPSKRVSPSSSGTSRMRSRSSPFARSRTSAPRPPRKRPWPSQGFVDFRGLLRGPRTFARTAVMYPAPHAAPNRSCSQGQLRAAHGGHAIPSQSQLLDRCSRRFRHPRSRRGPVLASFRLMFLKSLTLRGFKSFAEKTTLDFEPGITVIVGPNGSGKSNVVDAIAWVLGEQGPKSLRGGKMEDVIFAGTGSRGALGRAEVALTIDNSAGLLPIEYTEVTVTRLLYRSGESEYAINATPCRLLDIQELLSDTGVGRELHTVLGQNRLEDVLQGRPEDRRAAIEEAAGVYKHRRRKEKALRKLAGMEQHLVRLSDLVGELRRQLKPLQQQAETAARAAEVAAELREVRLALRARELATLRERSASLDAEEAAFATRLAELEQRHDAEEARERALQAELAELEHLAEALAEETDGRSVADLEREAAEVAEELARVEAELAATTATADEAAASRNRARAALAAFDQAAARAERDRAAAHRREVRLASEVAGLERTIEQMEAEAGRLRGQTAARHLVASERRVEAERAAARARREAFEATARAAGGDALAFLEGAGRDGVLGPLAPALSVTPGYEAAVAAALGPDADAIVVAGPTVATAGARLLRDASSGRAILLHPPDPAGPRSVAGTDPRSDAPALRDVGPRTGRVAEDRDGVPELSTGATRVDPGRNGAPLLLDRVATNGFGGEVARALLAGVLVADDLEQARELLERHPERRVVTLAGELLAAGRAEGGVVPEASGLAARRAADEAAEAEAAATATLERVGAELRAAQRELEAAEGRAAEANRALRDAQAAVRRIDDQATMVGKELRALDREAATAAERLHELDSGRERTLARLGSARTELATAPQQGVLAGTGLERDAELLAGGREPLAETLDQAEQAATAAQVAGA